MAMRVALGLPAAGGHGFGVVAGVFHHRHAALAQAFFFPVLGVGRHVHGGLKPQRRGHHANAQAQVAGGADRDLVLAEQGAGRRAGQHRVVVSALLQQPVLQRQGFSQLQHLMDAATRLDGPGHRQAVVGLDQQTPEIGRQTQRRLQRGHGQQRRLDDAASGLKFREKGLHDRLEQRKACQRPFGIFKTNVRAFAGEVGHSGQAVGGAARVEPQQGLRRPQTGGDVGNVNR